MKDETFWKRRRSRGWQEGRNLRSILYEITGGAVVRGQGSSRCAADTASRPGGYGYKRCIELPELNRGRLGG
jgi:hypothetical protein